MFFKKKLARIFYINIEYLPKDEVDAYIEKFAMPFKEDKKYHNVFIPMRHNETHVDFISAKKPWICYLNVGNMLPEDVPEYVDKCIKGFERSGNVHDIIIPVRDRETCIVEGK